MATGLLPFWTKPEGGCRIIDTNLSGRDLRSDYWDRPAFETIRPRRLTAPIVFNSAHSGRDYPDRFLGMTRLDQLSIRQSEDAWVDELFVCFFFFGFLLLCV